MLSLLSPTTDGPKSEWRTDIVKHGEQDAPGPHNYSASYNEPVEPALAELEAIYGASDAGEPVSLFVTPDSGHEMNIADLTGFLQRS